MTKRTGLRRIALVMKSRLAAILVITFCSTLTPLPERAFPVETGAKVRSSRKTPAQRTLENPSPVQLTASACAPITKTSFSDDKFLMADWDTSQLPGGSSVPGYATTYVSAGGNPADFRNIQMRIAANAPHRHFAHLLKGYTFDPAREGAIVAIDGGYDLKNQTRNDVPASFALLLYQNDAYYRGPSDSIAANNDTWSTFNHPGLKATDFVNLLDRGSPNPDFSCAGKPIQIGFVALSGRGTDASLVSGIDNWSIHFQSTCCSASPVGVKPASAGSHVDPKRQTSEGVTSRCCCDDDEAVVDEKGTVILPENLDMDSPPVFEYVDQELGEVSDLYPGADTTLDTWCQKYPCKPAIGGVVPKEAEEPNLDIELAEQGIEGVSAADINKQITSWEKEIVDKESKAALKWQGLAAPNYTPPPKPYQPPERQGVKYAFGGRDIVFVHGLKLEHVFDRIKGKPAAKVNWKQPAGFPASSTNPAFYTGYYHNRAALSWSGTGAPGMGGHIAEFLRSKGYRNRFLIVSYNCSERLDVAARAILAQIGDAMVYGTGVVDPMNPKGPPPRNFGTPSFVVISHSTGGLVTDVAMTAARQIPNLKAAYIPKYCKAHIAVQGAHRGSRLATAAIVLSGYTAVVAPSWLWPLVRQIFVQMNDPPSTVPLSPFGFKTFASSVLVDLVPSVAQLKWGKYVHDVPVSTLTVVGGHPTFLQPLKFILQPGFDDGVVNINSQVANPNNVLLWPSGFRTDAAGLIQNFDMGVFGLGPNFQVTANVGGSLVNFSVNISNTSLNSPARAAGYYINQKFDRISSPGNVIGFPQPFFFAAGATPYISPTGMLQTIAAEYGSGSGIHPLSANPLNRNPNIFSFLQSASDHFKGTHDQVMGFNGVLYGNSPIYDTANGERNFEETRVLTDTAVYAPFQMPYGDNEPLLRPQNVPQVIESIRGLRVTFRLKFFKKKWTKTWWVWKRRYHLLDGWETKRQFDYVYESVLKN